MKKIFYIAIAIAFFCGCSEEPQKPTTGGIEGTVADKTTGDLVPTVPLSLEPGGKSAVTGSDGHFGFTNLEPGNFYITISKEGYKPTSQNNIIVVAGKNTPVHILIERIPAIVTVDRDTLDFGANASVTMLSFSIVNPGYEDLIWYIEQDCQWIKEIKPNTGTLKYEKTESISIVIDRQKLAGGNNETKIAVISTNGRSELTIKAVGEDKSLPVLNTLETTNKTSNSAIFNGEILSSGTPAYTERGFVYSLSSMPTTETTIAKLTASLTESKTYSAIANGLIIGKTYYVRAYAINANGTAYSTNEVNFNTEMSLPTVTTQEVTNKNIGAGTVTFNGTITYVGDPAYTERGFTYGLVHNPTIDDNTKKTASGTGTGIFSSNLTGLAAGNVYYVRAYAMNVQGPAYGSEVICDFAEVMPKLTTQAVTNINISSGTATFNGTIINVGDPVYTERGFAYGKTHNPTINDTKKPATGTGTGAYSLNVSGIQEGSTYYVRAYATNAKGTVYGEEVSFDFYGTMPSVTTQAVTNINVGAGTATFNGTVVSVGAPACTERGFVYGKTRNPTVEDTKKAASGTGTGAYSLNVTGIQEGSTYYVRAYAISNKGTVYGEEVSFNFSASLPTLTTQAVTNINIGSGTATLNGTIVTVGDPAYTERGFVYSTSTNTPTIGGSGVTKVTVSGNSTGTFNTSITGLTANTTYYVRAYATNLAGTAYGGTTGVSFTTPPTELKVSVTTINAAYITGDYSFDITSNTAWTIISNQNWCTVSPTSGSGNRTITITLTENTNTDETVRTALLTVTAGTESKQVTIEQEPKGSSIFGNGIVAAARFDIGNGTQSSPFLIYNARQLKKLVDDVTNDRNSYYNTYFKLTTDIQVTADEWIPIVYSDGNSSSSFSGIFDGNGHTISGTMKSNRYPAYGFFGGLMEPARISNLTIAATVKNESVVTGMTMTGAIAGSAGGEIINCSVTGTVTGGFGSNYSYTGGIGGSNDGIIRNCTVSKNITGDRTDYLTGGIVGRNDGEITNCTVSTSVTITGGSNSDSHIGGIAGCNMYSATITNCTNNATVTGNISGGLVGLNYGMIHTSLNTGDITGSSYTGGLAGHNCDYNAIYIAHIYSCNTNQGRVNGASATTSNQIGSGKPVETCPDGHTKR